MPQCWDCGHEIALHKKRNYRLNRANGCTRPGCLCELEPRVAEWGKPRGHQNPKTGVPLLDPEAA